jgi:hypothetical protein
MAKLSDYIQGVPQTNLNKTGDTMTGALNFAPPVTLASAATVNIGGANSNFITLTGTATINAFDVVAAGVEREVTHTGVQVLTYNATSMIMPGIANITTAVNDVSVWRSLGSGNWQMTSYLKADGTLVAPVVATAAQYLAATPNKYLTTDSVWNAGTEVALTSLADATVTISIATPGIITDTAHGLPVNAPVHFTTTGALPTGLVINTEYYVSTVVDANNYQIAATRGGSAIATSGSQSGVHTRIARVLVDFSLGLNFAITLVRNVTVAKPYNHKAGQGGRVRFTQDGTGSRLVVFPTGWKTSGGAAMTVSTAAASEDYVFYDAPSSSSLITNISKAFI